MTRKLWAFAVVGIFCPTAAASEFAPVYETLLEHCGHCHKRGGASSWVTDLPAGGRYPGCQGADEYRCTTHQQLVEIPGPDMPAWVRPAEPAASEPYVNACDAENSFHIGVSLPEKLPDGDCEAFLGWITDGAKP